MDNDSEKIGSCGEGESRAESSKHFYFAYASNMVKERILRQDPQAVLYGAAKLDVSILNFKKYIFFECLYMRQGYKLEFNYKSQRWQGAMATITESPQDHVWGIIWEKHNSTIPILDE